jgi:hypothetical protein
MKVDGKEYACFKITKADRAAAWKVLLRQFVRPLIAKHPLPWCIEQDWTLEITDNQGAIVFKCMRSIEAIALIELAEELNKDDREA